MQRLRAAYRRARPWIPLVAAAAIALGASAAIGLTAIERASKGPAFRVSAACLRLNATVRQELGVVTGFGFTVQGPVVQNADGTGHARLDFTRHRLVAQRPRPHPRRRAPPAVVPDGAGASSSSRACGRRF